MSAALIKAIKVLAGLSVGFNPFNEARTTSLCNSPETDLMVFPSLPASNLTHSGREKL
jgi:hypothetical protein